MKQANPSAFATVTLTFTLCSSYVYKAEVGGQHIIEMNP